MKIDHIGQSRNLNDYINESVEITLVESVIGDIYSKVKNKVSDAIKWLKSALKKVGNYFFALDANGEILPVVTAPSVAALAKEGKFNDHFFYKPDKASAELTGYNPSDDDIKKVYGNENSLEHFLNFAKKNKKSKTISDSLNPFYNDDLLMEKKIANDDTEMLKITSTDRLVKKIEQDLRITRNLAKKALETGEKGDYPAPMLIWGAPGIGKTAMVDAVVKAHRAAGEEFGFIVRTLSQLDNTDFSLPKAEDIKLAGQDTQRLGSIVADWLPMFEPTDDKEKNLAMDAALGKGILFVDELARTKQSVLNGMLTILNERRLGKYILGSGWMIIGATNRAEDEISGQVVLGSALTNRFKNYSFEPTFQSWESWAKKQKFISPLLLQWLALPENENLSGGKYFYWDPNEDTNLTAPTSVFCTPRAWTEVMKTLSNWDYTGNLEGFKILDLLNEDAQEFMEAVNQSVPKTAAEAFVAFLRTIRGIGDLDQVANDVWKKGKGEKLKKSDLNRIAIPMAQLICLQHGKSFPTTEEFTNMAKWLVSQDSDQLTASVLDVFKTQYCGGLVKEEKYWDCIFLIKALIEKKAENKEMLSNYFNAFMKKWGIKDIDSFPDYSEGLQTLNKKFGDIYRKYTINGEAALA
jgi:hypothetical protein